ncbi:hypothetical protein LR948_08020 [Roseivivax sp. GX 12232]|uniref:hypothetical protein n=1 Tax=Roseivivax sp. GX 12232 TaxID=2900547 RepID=UPI001E3AA42B|nr:hypothetical protein [Roseivivax sp. GX 12232]MCE0505293.1 hypothetical protein [Roseivivax sp. GX 12232]
MVSSSKILTVSYGTFSCTLEGFDDSFDTMKAIAEYFRDLAQDDRYFGAEPPTPDAEMLARIAEREIARRVEARFEQDGGVVLRPSLAQPGAAAAAAQGEGEAQTEAQPEAPAKAPEAASEAQPDDTTRAPEEDALAAAVEARLEAEARAAEAAARAEAAAAAEAPAPAEESPAPAAVAPATETAPAEAAAEEPKTNTPEEAAEAAAEDLAEDLATDRAPAPFTVAPEASVAAKLARIRAVVTSKAPAEDSPALTEDLIEDAHSEEMMGSGVPFLETEEEDDAEAPQPAMPAVPAAPAPETGEIDPEDADETAYGNARMAARLAAAEAADRAEAEVAASSRRIDETPEASEEDALEDTIAGLVAGSMGSAAEVETAEGYPAEDGDAEGVAELDETAEDAAEFAAELDEADSAEAADEAEMADAEAANEETDATEADDEQAAKDEAVEVGIDTADAADDADTPAPQRSGLRIMKMKRADFDRALASGDFEEVEEDAPGATSSVAPYASESTLSAEDEADLARELAAFEAEELGLGSLPQDADDADEDDTAETKPADPFRLTADHAAEDLEDDEDFARELDAAFGEDEAESPASERQEMTSAPQPALDGDDDAAQGGEQEVRRAVKLASPARAMFNEGRLDDQGSGVDRLMDETDREMEEPASRDRRSAIQHLRAAVAATRADRLLGRQDDEAEKTEPYREDLKSVVRPRRPVAERTAAEAPARPTPGRPAPLKLVAEQRVDEATARPRAIRPRRVAREEVAAPAAAADMSFGDYARQVGATELSELLEAAAAYMAFVEERPAFSRPQLMGKVREVEATESSREDRLRSFGVLLREGKIERLEGGRFTATQGIGFKPSKRAAG